MKRVTLLTVLLSALTGAAFAQSTHRTANFSYNYNLDATSLTYCVLNGQGGTPFGGPITGPGGITAATSTTATSSGAFTDLAVGDVITVKLASTNITNIRVVRAKASSSSITLDTAATWTSAAFSYLKLSCGTGDTDGWISTSGLSVKGITWILNQISGVTGGIDIRLECLPDGLGSKPIIAWPGASVTADCGPGTLSGGYCNYTTAGITTGRIQFTIPRDVACGAVRIGQKINTADAAETTEADREEITTILDFVLQ